NSFKATGYYNFGTWKRNSPTIGFFQQASSGTPLSTYVDVNGTAGSYPVYVVRRGNWVDITASSNGTWTIGNPYVRRTPWYSQTDASLMDDYKVSSTHESWRLGFEANFTNLLNQKAATAFISRPNAATGSTANYLLPTGSTAGNPNYGILENGYDWKSMANS